jgi:RNA polymerase sigma-70 factor (ECF subfamily)
VQEQDLDGIRAGDLQGRACDTADLVGPDGALSCLCHFLPSPSKRIPGMFVGDVGGSATGPCVRRCRWPPSWPDDGVPANPGGWLMTVARNRAIDVLRRASVERRKLRELAELTITDPSTLPGEEEVVDDRLRLIFTCCHPALALEARVALTLRTVCGVPTADIARALLVSESTMTRRLTRAKTKIKDAGIPYRVPRGRALDERLPGVLAVLYLLFTRGYNADGELTFADEAIRLTRLLAQLMPSESEVAALLALFLFQHSRRDARRDAVGNLLTLDKQDRGYWDHAAIAEGVEILTRTRENGPYALQARIAACHATAASTESTAWPVIARWSDELARRGCATTLEETTTLAGAPPAR